MRSKPKTKTGKAAKMGKVMHEFKGGMLHSGSKSGPKVKSRKQAIAIGMSEAGMGKKARGKRKM
jgi:hypothetical protein